MNFDLQPRDGYWSWRATSGTVGVCFAGKPVDGGQRGREATVRHLVPAGVEPAWLQQIHSALVVDARPGENGPADGLTTRRPELGLAVVTADCVPVLLAAGAEIAAVHAGWRGLADRIVPAALDRLWRRGRIETTAWIGPAIGPCCYEVGEDVAARVAGASSEEVVREGRRGRPHLDLSAAARLQLQQLGVEDVRELERCTRCDQRLCSYRRDGPRAGRNVALIWRAGGRG
jgi:purine-nucleoside/S-methyl-5'-thioadenosine phosphorylase / adenosine deaminase